MFRFIHTADLHLDSPLRGLEKKEGAPVDVLRGATREAFQNLVDTAIEREVDFILIAGDLYDGDWQDYSTGLFFVRQASRLLRVGIPIYLISGNHDAFSVITRQLNPPENVTLFSSRKAATVEPESWPVAIHGQSFPKRSVPENLAASYPKAIPAKFNIGLLHTSLTGREGHDTYAPCSIADLTNRGYDYWALGHIHMPEIVSQDPLIVFPGNTQGRHIKETGERGCHLITVDDELSVVENEFIPLDVIRWQRIAVDLSGAETDETILGLVREAISHAIDEADNRLLAARIELTGQTILHGDLLHRGADWRAKIDAEALHFGEDQIWIEKIKIATSPLYDLDELAERDDLTRQVIDSLEQLDQSVANLPESIQKLKEKLPAALQQLVEESLESDELEADVKSLVIESLIRSADL